MIVGVSTDDAATHDAWIAKLGLTFTLVADTEGVAVNAYGAVAQPPGEWQGKPIRIARTTFLIGPDGVIERVWEKVKAAGHAQEVLAALRESL